MNTCEICKKKSSFNGYVWIAEGKFTDLYLCRSHYLKWCKNKEGKEIEKRYENAKPTTKEWHKKCQELQKAFDKWFEQEFVKEGGKEMKYCECASGGLIIANLKEGEGKCPICNLPKKLNKRLKTMSKVYNFAKGEKTE